MKSLFTFLGLLIISITLQGQTSGGPDAYGYTWKNSRDSFSPPQYKWVDIISTGTLVTGLGDDNFVGPFSPSNGFQFYWYPTQQFYIGSNGFISFNGVNIASPFPSFIPDPLGGNDYIAAMLSDLNFSGVGNQAKCYYWGNADSLVVSFIGVPFWYATGNFTGTNTFQFILSKIDKSITINYRKMNMGLWTAIDAIGGIENVTGTLGLQCYTDSLPEDSTTIKFYYPPVVTYMVRDIGVNWNDNDKNGGIFVKKGGVPMPLMANIKNFGNQTITNITVYDTVYNASGTAVTNGVANIASLAPGQDITVQFSDSFSPSAAQTYKFRTRLFGVVGDMVASNDYMVLEVISIDTAAALMYLDYSDGLPDGAGINWTGGGGGIGIYIEPPFYPSKVKESRFYITAAGSPAPGFYAIIYDDNGPGGSPGTVLDSVFVAPTSISIGSYKVVPPSQTIVIDSGGVYLYWGMAGAGISLGRDINVPISRRSFEVLGGSWSGYRSMHAEDFLMGLGLASANPKADFIVNSIGDPTLIFTDKTTNQPTSWHWYFGDGATDTLQNPNHTYIDNDTFPVCLAVTNLYGSDSICKNVVIDGNIPTADFLIDETLAPTIAFYDQSTNTPTSWFWDFDDGPGDTSIAMNTAHKYLTNKVFNVCLTASNINGSSLPVCKTVEISGLGVIGLEGASVEIFPNPMSDYATIRLSQNFDSESIQVRMFDMHGRELKPIIERNGREILIRKGESAVGQYIVEISGGGQILTRTLLQISNN